MVNQGNAKHLNQCKCVTLKGNIGVVLAMNSNPNLFYGTLISSTGTGPPQTFCTFDSLKPGQDFVRYSMRLLHPCDQKLIMMQIFLKKYGNYANEQIARLETITLTAI